MRETSYSHGNVQFAHSDALLFARETDYFTPCTHAHGVYAISLHIFIEIVTIRYNIDVACTLLLLLSLFVHFFVLPSPLPPTLHIIIFVIER